MAFFGVVVLALVAGAYLLMSGGDLFSGVGGGSGGPATSSGQSGQAAAPGKPTSAGPTSQPRPNLGTAAVKAHASDKLVQTKTWGTVPVNQMGIVLKDGLKRSDAETVARSLGGSVVGEISYINLYQLEIPTSTEADLVAALQKAKGTSGVDLAFPNQTVELFADIKGARCSPLNDPVYSGPRGTSYQMIGVQNAWDILKAVNPTLNDVHVGVTDTGLFKGNDEFDGDIKVNTGGPDDVANQPDNGPDGKPKPHGTHGTAVAGIIGANPDNGGQAGVASPLGKKMEISVTNVFGQKYGGYVPVPPDPNDPAKFVSGGQTFSIGPLAAIKDQIDKGATIINCSWGTNHRDQNGNWVEGSVDLAQAYRRFFAKMARDHPKVIFVVAAGNDGKAINGNAHYPGGAPLPNMITVGNLESDGSRWNSSNMNGNDFEVTLGAPGHRAVAGVSADGRVQNEYGGTSYASPQVAAAAAIIRSLNPNLNAADIKRILVETAATDSDVSGTKVPIDGSVGGRVLRVDNAVLHVLKDLGKVPADATIESLLRLGTIDAVASGTKPMEYTVKATLSAVGAGGTDVKIDLWGEGMINGPTTQRLDKAGDVSWGLTLLKPGGKPSVKVTRMDNSACTIIHLEPVDLTGTWAGTMTITDVRVYTDTITIPDPFDDKKPPTVITREECEKNMKDELNKEQKLTMEFKPASAQSGTVIVGSAESAPAAQYYLAGDWLTIGVQQKDWHYRFEGLVTEEGDSYKISGSMRVWLGSTTQALVEGNGVWNVGKPKGSGS